MCKYFWFISAVSLSFVFALVWFFNLSIAVAVEGNFECCLIWFFSFFFIQLSLMGFISVGSFYNPCFNLFLLSHCYMHKWSALFSCTVYGNASQCCFISPWELIFCTFFLCLSNTPWRCEGNKSLRRHFFLSLNTLFLISTLFVCFLFFFFFPNMHDITISSVPWNWETWTSIGFGNKFNLSTLFWPLTPRDTHSDCIN